MQTVEQANRCALTALRAILSAAHPLELTIGGTKIAVKVRRPPDAPWPKGAVGIDEKTDGPWPPPVQLDCTWNGGSVTVEARVAIWRGSRRYNGQVALQVATLPLNREILWSTVASRILSASDGARCKIPVSLGLFEREGDHDTRALLAALVEQTRSLGLDQLSPAIFRLFDISPNDAAVAPSPNEAFERIVKAALAKLPYVVRGEDSDVQGSPFVDIARARPVSPPSAQPLPPEPVVEGAETSTQENVFFESIEFENLAGFEHFKWEDIGRINVIVGRNDSGKSHLLKMLYAISRSVQEFTARSGADSDRPAWADVLAEKLLWTFQPPSGKLGDLVRHGVETLFVNATLCNEFYGLTFDKNTGRTLTDSHLYSNQIRPQPGVRALFIPPKEVLTSMDAIAAVREQLKRFGFDDTYYDLVVALRGEPIQVDLPPSFQRVLSSLESLLTGRIESENGRFFFKRDDDRFGMAQVAEGIKKIGLFTRLIQNGSLRRNSILFIDEPETNLHPRAARELVRMLHDLSQAGVQIYAATHSYFILKQFEILARKHKTPIQLCCLKREERGIGASFFDLQEGMPDNGIVEEALRLYDEDVDLAMEG